MLGCIDCIFNGGSDHNDGYHCRLTDTVGAGPDMCRMFIQSEVAIDLLVASFIKNEKK